MAGIKPEKRLYPRRCLQVPIVFQKWERLLWSISEDIGTGGLFLKSYCPPDPGEDLKIHLADPRAGEPMVLRGKVVHRREGTKAGLFLEKMQRPAGVGIAFEDVSPIQEERLRALLSERGLSSTQGEATAPCPEAEGEDREAPASYQGLEDPAEIRRVFQALCKKIHPVRMKRLGGRIHYTTYFRDVIGLSVPFRVEAEAVGLKDFDSVFSEKVPFAFLFDLEEYSYFFSVTERPEVMASSWSFALPPRLYRGPDRRSPRYSSAIKHPLTVEFPDPADGSLQQVKNVLDIGFGGLAFKNDPGEEVYSPGQFLSNMEIFDFDRACWKTDGLVRHTSFVCLPNGGVFQKVGIEFTDEGASELKEVPPVKEGEVEKIEAHASIRHHLKRVASTRVQILSGLDHTILFSDGRLFAEKQNGGLELTVTSHLLSQSAGSDLAEGRLSYHYLYHGTYHFFSARTKKQNGSLCLEMPAVINRVRRRKAVRVRPEGMVKTRFRCFHPVLGRKVTFPVRDLSIRGLSFESDYTRDLFWRGIRLRSCEILFGDEYHPLGSVRVRTLVQSVTGTGEWDRRCGVEFHDLPAETESRLSAYILRNSNPRIRAPVAERIENVWELFTRSGFLYPSKMAYIRKMRPEIDETWKRLLSDDTPFYKQIVFSEGEEELGTASAVQVYEDTWLFQHLAASSHPVRLISKDVMLGLAQFLMENRNAKYLITYFRKENSFPRKMYGGFLDRYPSEEEFCFEKYHFLSLDLDEQERVGGQQRISTLGSGGGINVGHARDTDKEIIECYFEKHLHPLLIRSRSLSRDVLHLPETAAMFRDKGLKRERSCLVAKQGGKLLAFALLENSSLGVNLSGLLNAFSIYTVHPEGDRACDARRSLLDAALTCYRSWGARVAICLTKEDVLSHYMDAGFRKEKEYVCLSWSRRMIKNYYDYVQEKFSRFEERKQGKPQEPVSDPPNL
jgi:hypothetical protein